jgi:hypothetical protein
VSAGVFDEVEWLWWVGIVEADGYHERTRPSTGMAAVILAVDRLREAHGTAIARDAGRAQPWTTAIALPKLARFGMVAHRARPGGGRAGRYWRLTDRGQRLADLLAEEATA